MFEKILIIDDEKEIRDLISLFLTKDGYKMKMATNGQEALKIINTEHFDLIVLDVLLPDINGVDLCVEIRKKTNAPIIFLSCKGEEIDKIVALKVGGDDYVTKPFSPQELMARIQAQLRRSCLIGDSNRVIDIKGIKINLDAHTVQVQGSLVNLTAKEFELLSLMAQNRNRVYSPELLYQLVWKSQPLSGEIRTVAVHISNIRKKIEKDPYNPVFIQTIRGVGYKFID